jgi:hypothetical protein
MKKRILLVLPFLVLLATGCPVGLDSPLGELGKEKIDPRLIGTWHSTSTESEVQRITIAEGDKNSYDVKVTERGEMYSLETDVLKGWVTAVKEKNFVFFQPESSQDDKPQFYHYCYWWDGSSLITCDLALLDGGVDAVTDTKSLRAQVERSMVKDEWGNETIEWNKE